MASGSTVLRVKRRLEDNPQDALVLMCKRIKTDSDSEIAPSLFIFRGTVENQAAAHVKSLKEFKINSKEKVSKIIEKIRQERKDVAAESRYEIVNCSRKLKFVENTELLNLVDLQKKEKEQKEDDVNYAYDLYTAVKNEFDISMIDNLVSIEDFQTDLVFGSYRDNGQLSSEGEESDDSNDENNWRNDYPDSEHSSIDEDDIIKAVQKIDLEDDLSSDAGEDRIYDEPADLFQEDAKRYGEAYAKYKARVLAQHPDLAEGSALVHCTRMKDESVSGYKGDSDDDFYYGAEEDTDHFREQYRHGLDSEEDSEAENDSH